jgi:hypothetical protein
VKNYNYNIVLSIFFSILGIVSVVLGLSVDLECVGVTAQDNLIAGLPLWVFGVYCLFTSLLLWKKPEIGRSFVAVAVLIALILITASVFDLSIPIIKTSCV